MSAAQQQQYQPFKIIVDGSFLRNAGQGEIADRLEQTLPSACQQGLLSTEEAMEFHGLTADVLDGKLLALEAQMWLSLSNQDVN